MKKIRPAASRWIPFLILILPVLLNGSLRADNPLLPQKESQNHLIVSPDDLNKPATLESVTDLLIHGDFDQAEKRFNTLPGQIASSPDAQHVRQILDEYQQLIDQMKTEHQKSYDETYRKMIESVELARWRAELLDVGKKHDIDVEEKKTFDDEQTELVEKKWLGALAQWTICKSIAERVPLNEKNEPALIDEIIEKAVDFANKMENNHDWLEAYQRVYSYLTSLDPQNEQYEKHALELIRKASLIALYVPDPNQDSIAWQERRKDITFDIINTSLGILNNNYVEQPDYNLMSQSALEYCRAIADTPRLSETFKNLAEENLSAQYRRQIETLADEINNLPAQQYGYYYLLSFLRKIMRINEDTIALPEEVVMAEFTDGAFSALDGYTHLVWPGDVAEFRKDMTGEFYGVGIMIGKTDGLLSVSSLLEESPARQAGIDAGDTIVAIDGKSTANITLDMAVRRITGKENTDVVLSINRDGFDSTKDFTITRRKIVVNDVKGLYRNADGQWQYMLDSQSRVGYIRLTNFFDKTAERIENIYRQLQNQNCAGLVLDLRNNSGGYLSTAIQIVDQFVSNGVIVSTRRRGDNEGLSDFASPRSTLNDKIPLVVLVNAISASASEIVSGSLQDHHRALIVGTHTFGKGNVQTIQPLRPSEAEMKITIAYYYLPSNRRVHRDPKDKISKDYGVIPDVPLEMTSNQLREMIDIQQKAAILHQNGPDVNTDKWTVFNADQVLDSDPQLKLALLCIKAQLLKNHHPELL